MTVKLGLLVTVGVGVRLGGGVRLPEAERVALGEGRVGVGVGVPRGVRVRVGVADVDRDGDGVAVGERWEAVMGGVVVRDVLEVREVRVGEEEGLGVVVGVGCEEAVRECVTVSEALWLWDRVSEPEGGVGLWVSDSVGDDECECDVRVHEGLPVRFVEGVALRLWVRVRDQVWLGDAPRDADLVPAERGGGWGAPLGVEGGKFEILRERRYAKANTAIPPGESGKS